MAGMNQSRCARIACPFTESTAEAAALAWLPCLDRALSSHPHVGGCGEVGS